MASARSPQELADASRRLSLVLQEGLRGVLPLVHLENLKNLGNLVPAASLLTWQAIRPRVGMQLTRTAGSSVEETLDGWRNNDLLKAVVYSAITALAADLLVPIRMRLPKVGLPTSENGTSLQITKFLQAAMGEPGMPVSPFKSVLACEGRLIDEALHALSLTQDAVAAAEPSDALEALAGFGDAITNAFNGLAASVAYPSDVVRTLWQSVFGLDW